MALVDFLLAVQRELPLRGGTLERLAILTLLRESPRSIASVPGVSINWLAGVFQSPPESVRHSITSLRAENVVRLAARIDRTQLFAIQDEACVKLEACLALLPRSSATHMLSRGESAYRTAEITGAR